ncbi:hypothetical protein BDZ89DRAFT_1133635 [Hymenopellis radicata]|nr:hypothetical protein BDZ89DRAFT_1133635 [Hymenopellis radicata]
MLWVGECLPLFRDLGVSNVSKQRTTAIDIEHELLIGKALELQLDAYFSLRVRQRRSNAYASRLDPASSEEPRILFVWREKYELR